MHRANRRELERPVPGPVNKLLFSSLFLPLPSPPPHPPLLPPSPLDLLSTSSSRSSTRGVRDPRIERDTPADAAFPSTAGYIERRLSPTITNNQSRPSEFDRRVIYSLRRSFFLTLFRPSIQTSIILPSHQRSRFSLSIPARVSFIPFMQLSRAGLS